MSERVSLLTQMLDHADPAVRFIAVQGIKALGPSAAEAIPVLLRWLQEPALRNDALPALCKVSIHQAVDLVVAPDVRAEVLGLLGEGKKVDAVKRVRAVCCTGLMVAKHLVEAIELVGRQSGG
jgi:hypothetical protein